MSERIKLLDVVALTADRPQDGLRRGQVGTAERTLEALIQGTPLFGPWAVYATHNLKVKGKVNLKETPFLEWSWKVTVLPRGGDSCKKATDDQAAQVFVVWPRFPEPVRSRVIGYVWDTTEPVGKICKSEKTGTVTYIVLRSGTAELGKWVTERRNLVEDFKKIYQDDPDEPAAVSLAIDSNDTNSTAESYIGPILFKKP